MVFRDLPEGLVLEDVLLVGLVEDGQAEEKAWNKRTIQ